jgi:hypothetical protein
MSPSNALAQAFCSRVVASKLPRPCVTAGVDSGPAPATPSKGFHLLGIVWSRLARAHGPLPSASTASRSVGDCAEWVSSRPRPSSGRHPRVVGRRATFDHPASIRACQRAVLEPALIVGPISATGVSVRVTKLSQNLRSLRRRWRARGCGSGLTCWAGRDRERSVAWADLHRRVAALVCGPRRGVINRPARLVAIGAGRLFRSGSAVGSGSGRG